jgi:hypothetical protein
MYLSKSFVFAEGMESGLKKSKIFQNINFPLTKVFYNLINNFVDNLYIFKGSMEDIFNPNQTVLIKI